MTKVLAVREKLGPNGYGEYRTRWEFDRAFGGILGFGDETAKARPYFAPAGSYLGTDQDVSKVGASGTVMQASVVVSVAVPLVVEGVAALPGAAKAAWVATEPAREAAMALSYSAAEKLAEISAAATVLANQKITETTHRIMNFASDPRTIEMLKGIASGLFSGTPPTTLNKWEIGSSASKAAYDYFKQNDYFKRENDDE